MLAQIRFLPRAFPGGGRFIPPPDLFSPLASLGQSIATIIDPQADTKRQLALLFLANPALGQQFAAAQRRAERERVEAVRAEPPPELTPEEIQAAATARERIPPAVTREAERLEVPPPANILPFFPVEFTRAVLAPFPPTVEEEALARPGVREQVIGTITQDIRNRLTATRLEAQKQQHTVAAASSIESLAATERNPLRQGIIRAALASEDYLTGLLPLLEFDLTQLVESLRALPEPVTAEDHLRALQTATATISEYNDLLSNQFEAFREANFRERPAMIADLQSLFNQRKFISEEVARLFPGFDPFQTVAVTPEFSAIRKRMQDFVTLTPFVADPELGDLRATMEAVANGDEAQGIRGIVQRIEAGQVAETSNAILAAIRKFPQGGELLDRLNPQQERGFIQGILDTLEERRVQAREVAIGREPQDDLQEQLSQLKAARERLKTAALARTFGGRRGALRVPPGVEVVPDVGLVDGVTGMTREEVDAEIKLVEAQLGVFKARRRTQIPLRR